MPRTVRPSSTPSVGKRGEYQCLVEVRERALTTEEVARSVGRAVAAKGSAASAPRTERRDSPGAFCDSEGACKIYNARPSLNSHVTTRHTAETSQSESEGRANSALSLARKVSGEPGDHGGDSSVSAHCTEDETEELNAGGRGSDYEREEQVSAEAPGVKRGGLITSGVNREDVTYD